MNTLSFDVNNQQVMKLTQRDHDGKVLICVSDKSGLPDPVPEKEAWITPGDFVMLINYFRSCKRAGKEIF